MTSLKDSAIRNIMGTLLLLLLLGQPAKALKVLRRLGVMEVGVSMVTCDCRAYVRYWSYLADVCASWQSCRVGGGDQGLDMCDRE